MPGSYWWVVGQGMVEGSRVFGYPYTDLLGDITLSFTLQVALPVITIRASWVTQTGGLPLDPTSMVLKYKIREVETVLGLGAGIVRDSPGHYHADISTVGEQDAKVRVEASMLNTVVAEDLISWRSNLPYS